MANGNDAGRPYLWQVLAVIMSAVAYTWWIGSHIGTTDQRVVDIDRRLQIVEGVGSPALQAMISQVKIDTARLDQLEELNRKAPTMLVSIATIEAQLKSAQRDIDTLRTWVDQHGTLTAEEHNQMTRLQGQLNELLRQHDVMLSPNGKQDRN